MSIVLESQPYAIYPIVFNPYKVPSYKRLATFSDIPFKELHETSTDNHSSDKIRLEDYSAKDSSSLCLNESNVRKYSTAIKRQVNIENKKQINQKTLFKTIKKQLQDRSEIGNNWLLTSKINLIPRQVISSKKPIIPTPNMDMFQVNADKNNYISKTARSTSSKLTFNKRPHSVASTHSRLSNHPNPEHDTNISTASSHRSSKRFQYLSEESIERAKPSRPSSAPCILEEYDRAAPVISELEGDVADTESVVSVSVNNTDQESSDFTSDQKSSDQTVRREDEKLDENAKISPEIFDRKLLKECKIVLEDEYDQALRCYGWRMEIPGDPLNLKSKLLPKRLPYSVKLHLQPTLRQPPKMTKQNVETFFQPTVKIPIPSFTIHPDFTSEFYNAHRNYMIKKDLWNYATRNYSFAY
uniref:PPP1R35_C domain-containing protein n=1 Tax=Schistosoma mansoni TaxID=6183 RepID=A0A3Q0KS98_SCHMA